MTTQTPFKWHYFQADIILLCIYWYVCYSLSYCNLEEIMVEQGLHVDHMQGIEKEGVRGQAALTSTLFGVTA